jgi:hypothetical protein
MARDMVSVKLVLLSSAYESREYCWLVTSAQSSCVNELVIPMIDMVVSPSSNRLATARRDLSVVLSPPSVTTTMPVRSVLDAGSCEMASKPVVVLVYPPMSWSMLMVESTDSSRVKPMTIGWRLEYAIIATLHANSYA